MVDLCVSRGSSIGYCFYYRFIQIDIRCDDESGAYTQVRVIITVFFAFGVPCISREQHTRAPLLRVSVVLVRGGHQQTLGL